MPGVRLIHPTLKGCVLTVPDFDRPLVEPHHCPLCADVHAVKTYHLALDADGAVIVSPPVWERLRRLQTSLRVANEVRRPPRLVVGTPDRDRRPIVRLEGR